MVNIERLSSDLGEWGPRERGILGIAFVGSHARGTARPESDVDVVILLSDSAASAKDTGWPSFFGEVQSVRDEDWGLVQAKRVRYADGTEVKFSFTTAEWAATDPCDADTLAVVRKGFRVVYDPKRLLRTLAIDSRPDRPERHGIRSTCGRYEADVWFVPAPSDAPHALAVFLDGEFYLHDMDCLPVLHEARTLGNIPALSCAFVSFIDAESRQKNFTCDPHYARFIAEDIPAWAKQRDEMLTDDTALLCGVSLSGLAAAYTAVQHPDAFSSALCQSGSFWWLEDHTVSVPSTSARLWLSVGALEVETGVTHPPTGMLQRVSQIEGVENAARLFESRGASVHYNLHSGGHSFAHWREELAPALRWLAGGNGGVGASLASAEL